MSVLHSYQSFLLNRISGLLKYFEILFVVWNFIKYLGPDKHRGQRWDGIYWLSWVSDDDEDEGSGSESGGGHSGSIQSVRQCELR